MERPDTFIEVEVADPTIAIPRLCVSDALRGLAHSVRLFTPALLLTHGGFDRDPVREFVFRAEIEKPDERPFVIDLKRDHERFFTGLGAAPLRPGGRPVNWDQRLYAVPEQHADDCFSFLGGLAFSNPAQNFYASTLSYDLQICDPTSTVKAPLTVKIFGVLANTFVAYIETAFFAPRPVKRIGATGFKLSDVIPAQNLLFTPVDDDPLKMRES